MQIHDYLIFGLLSCMIFITVVYNYFFQKALNILDKWMGVWVDWAGPFLKYSKEDMVDIYKLAEIVANEDACEEVLAARKALKEILEGKPITAFTLVKRSKMPGGE